MTRTDKILAILIVSIAILFIALDALGQISSVMQGCPPGTITCNRITAGFGNELNMSDGSVSQPCTQGTADPTGLCNIGSCYFDETDGTDWWCTSGGWVESGGASGGARFIHVHKTGGAQTMTNGQFINGWTLQERSDVGDFTVSGSTITIHKTGVYLINGGVNARVDGDDPDCMTFSTTVDFATSSSAASSANTTSNEFLFQSVFSMVTDVSIVPATVQVEATECVVGSSVQVLSGSTWMNISVVSAVAGSGASGDVTDVGDCAGPICFKTSGSGNSLWFHGPAPGGSLGELTAAEPTGVRTWTLPNTSGNICLDTTCATSDTNAGTICSAGQFLNGDGTCDTVPVDTNAGTLCAAGQFLNGDGTCDTVVVDTNAGTLCAAGQFLNGDRTCDTVVVDTNAGTLCAAGQFLNGDGTCDSVVVDTNAGTICAAGEYLDGDGTCKTAASGGTPAGDENDIQFNSNPAGSFDGNDGFEYNGSNQVKLVAASADASSSVGNYLVCSHEGSLASPETIESGELIGDYRIQSYNATSCQSTVLMRALASENHGASNLGVNYKISTILTGTAVLVDRIAMMGSGIIQLFDETIIGDNMSGISITDTADAHPLQVGPDQFDYDIDFPAFSAERWGLIYSDTEINFGQAGGTFNGGPVMLHDNRRLVFDNATHSVVINAPVFSSTVRMNKEVAGTFLSTMSTFSDAMRYDNESGAAQTYGQHNVVYAQVGLDTTDVDNITLATLSGLALQPIFNCTNASATCEIANVYGLNLQDSTGNGAGTEKINTRVGVFMRKESNADTLPTKELVFETNLPYSLEEDSQTGLAAAFTVDPNAGHVRLEATADRTSNTTTAISDGQDDGQVLHLVNGASFHLTIKDNANTEMDGDFQMDEGDTITFIWSDDQSNWLEISRADNDSSDGGGAAGNHDDTGRFYCFGGGANDNLNNFFCIGSSATAANADYVPQEALTVTEFSCSQQTDPTCTISLTFAKNGTTTGSACSISNATPCLVTGLSSSFNGSSDGATMKVTTGPSGCANTAFYHCVIDYDYD